MLGGLVRLERVDGEYELEALDVEAEDEVVGHQSEYLHVLLRLEFGYAALLRKEENITRRVDRL